MDINILGNLVSVFINAVYPGGSAAFTDDGGLVSSYPGHDDYNVILYHPNIPKCFMEAIERIESTNNIKIKVVHEYNFMGCKTRDDFNTLIKPVMDSIIDDYNCNIIVNMSDPLLLSLITPNDLEEEEILDIISRIQTIPEFFRGYFIANNKAYVMDCPEIESRIHYISNPEPNHDKITEDQITDLKIALSQIESVDDFISKM